MSLKTIPTSVDDRETANSLEEILKELHDNLAKTLEKLKSLSPSLEESLHNGYELPNPENVNQAARTVDLLHEVQVLLDPPVLTLADHFLGYVRTKCLCAATERGVPDVLSKGPLSLTELADVTGSHSDRLGQILHILSNSGIFYYDETSQKFSNSPASLLLQTDHWAQWGNWVSLYGNQFYDIARGIPDSTRKDATRWGAQINYDTDKNMFTYFQEQGWVPQLHKTLGGGATAQMPGIIEDYPWKDVEEEVVMDVGGGGGALIAGLLQKYPNMRGGVFDLPNVIDHIRPFYQAEGQYSDLGNRVEEYLVAGDFFKTIPAYKVYTMKWVLHDWKDKEAVEILSNIRKSLVEGPRSRLIVLESVLSSKHSGRLSQYGDINMMMTANGQERTEQQWQWLAEQSGWKIVRIYDLRRAWVKALDLRPI